MASENPLTDRPLPELLKLPEVALALRVSRTTAYTLAVKGILPSLRFGGSVRVLRTDLEAFIAGTRDNSKGGNS